MDHKKNFYITLPSNSSMDFHPENTMGTFRVRLPEEIKLEGLWEVGMSDMIYSQTFVLPAYAFTVNKYDHQSSVSGTTSCEGVIDSSNENDDSRTIRITCSPDKEIEPSYEKQFVTTSSSFETATDFVAHLNHLVQEERDLNINFRLDPDNHSISVTLGSQTSLTADTSLLQILGFRDNQLESNYFKVPTGSEKFIFIGSAPCTISPIYTIYVYLDIISMVIVGDVMARLLDIVPVNTNMRGMTSYRVERPRYKPVERKNISDIFVKLRDDQGEVIRFLEGTVILKLHFRRI